MKMLQFILLSGILLFAPLSSAYTMTVSILANTSVQELLEAPARAVYWVKQVEETIANGLRMKDQFEKMVEAEKRAINNLKGAKDTKSFDDLMKWTNRRLYLEKQAEDKLTKLGVKVGGKDYKLTDIKKIPGALKEEFVDYWDNEFSEAQRKEMWIKLGLSPSNYVYIKTWQAREEALAKNIMTKIHVWNEENQKKNERKKEIMDALVEDQNKSEYERISGYCRENNGMDF